MNASAKWKRLSGAVAVMLVISLALPVLALAADRVVFHFDKTSQTVTGAVYYDDANDADPSVTKAVYVESPQGTQIDITNLLTMTSHTNGNGLYYSLEGDLSSTGVTEDVYGFHWMDDNSVFAGLDTVTGSVYQYVYEKPESNTGNNGGNGSSNGNGSPSTGGSIPDGSGSEGEESDPQGAEWILTEEDLQPDSNGRITLELDDSTEVLRIPADTDAIAENVEWVIQGTAFQLTIPGKLLLEHLDLLHSNEWSQAEIVLQMKSLQDEQISVVTAAENQGNTEMTPAGEVIDFELFVETDEGDPLRLTGFTPALTLSMRIDMDTEDRLTYMYTINEMGNATYVPGDKKDGWLTAKVSHFSPYGIFTYEKDYVDVKGSFWAYDVIRQLTAQQIVYGVSDAEFAPSRAVTRAEFTALLVRALQLKYVADHPFQDVKDTAWYAADVAAAYQAGLVEGRAADQFAPQEKITREEMAVMLMRAYERKYGQQTLSGDDNAFTDRTSISPWAMVAVNEAVELGLLVGQGEQVFNPKAWTTRAESAQVIQQLLP
ncbi:S-layer homology domain-containing protein [Marinicrinis sediminis]|uniref:S-layer homology domain-containing protein n=1 Tax=Marinicrinis sediminis TaxID=1652465 RepID=A0ABW5RAC9_9BACL